MKVDLQIDENFTEDRVKIEARKLDEDVSKLVDYIKQLGVSSQLTVRRGEEIHLLAIADIYQLYIADKVLYVRTESEEFTSHLRLYQTMEILPRDFLQISQSEIIHLAYLDHLSLTGNGLVKIVLKNGAVTYSSRRYLKQIKETLGL
ncbi:LytTR family DNA-binding domain-containing protein [Streptococcus sp. 20-1249]|uniref:LytTR family DNA-binding domain-containing protein n=1 Tax=Streptococcus hepaticus TaxID=3349163 RepID=UPI0037491720